MLAPPDTHHDTKLPFTNTIYTMKRDFLIAICITLSLLLGSGALTACKKENHPQQQDATVSIAVWMPDGTVAVGQTLLVFDEPGKEMLDKDPFAEPLAVLTTDAQGMAQYTLQAHTWFATHSERNPTFAVRIGIPGNYHLWSTARTVRPGQTLRLDLRLTAEPAPTIDTEHPDTPQTTPPTDKPTDTPETPIGTDSVPDSEETDTERHIDTEVTDPSSPETTTPENTPPTTGEDSDHTIDPENTPPPASALLTGLSIRHLPQKQVYTLGEPLDLNGLAVAGLYSDGTEQPLTIESRHISGFTSEQSTDQLTLTIEYNHHQASFTVSILPFRMQNGTITEITASSEEITLPAHTVAIAPRAGMFCKATRIVFNDGLQSIGELAFYGASITEIELPATLQTIGQEAFYQCSSLRRADLSQTALTTLPSRIFAYSGLAEIAWPGQLEEIGAQAFLSTSQLTQLRIPESVRQIGNEAFRESSLRSVTLPNSIRHITTRAFYLCKTLEEVTTYGITATIDGTLESACFERCPAITLFEIPESMAILGRGLLTGNSRLTTIRIPPYVQQIDFGAFDNTGIREVWVEATTPPAIIRYHGQWYGFPKDVQAIHVPAGTIDAYRAAEGWNSFTPIIQ